MEGVGKEGKRGTSLNAANLIAKSFVR